MSAIIMRIRLLKLMPMTLPTFCLRRNQLERVIQVSWAIFLHGFIGVFTDASLSDDCYRVSSRCVGRRCDWTWVFCPLRWRCAKRPWILFESLKMNFVLMVALVTGVKCIWCDKFLGKCMLSDLEMVLRLYDATPLASLVSIMGDDNVVLVICADMRVL